MRRLIALALVLVACIAPRPAPLAPAEAQASRLELALSVQVAAAMCTGNARHLAHVDAARGDALFARCIEALIPARDAVAFGVDVGCAGKAVRIGLEGVARAFVEAGYSGSVPGIANARRLEAWARPECDPIHPTTQRFVYVDPNIARVEPGYP